MTFRIIFVFFDKKITYNMKITGHISMLFYMVIYLSWFCKLGLSKSELRAKIDGSELIFC